MDKKEEHRRNQEIEKKKLNNKVMNDNIKFCEEKKREIKKRRDFDVKEEKQNNHYLYKNYKRNML